MRDKKVKDILTAVKGIMTGKKDEVKDKELPKEEWIGFMDVSNVTMLVAKKQWVIDLMRASFEVRETAYDKIPKLDYTTELLGKDNVATFSTEYLKVILLMTKQYESLDVYVKRDYPMTVKCEDFDYIIASRIRSE